jgi:uncharacterized protein (TIGR02246 family)
MTRAHSCARIAIVSLLMSGCGPSLRETPDRRSDDAHSIRDSETAWNRDLGRNDVERLVSRYADDATLLMPHTPPASGREAIRTALKQAVQDGNFSLRLENSRIEVARSGDLAYSEGTYEASNTDASGKTVSDTGTYVIVYRKADTGWKAIADIRTSSVPAAAK